jgi:hypothetical protein
MNLLTQNQKLKETSKELGLKIFNFSIPAYKSVNGETICKYAKDCVKYCYAQKGNYVRYPKNNVLREKKYQLTKQSIFVGLMNIEIKKKKAAAVRIHDSGDFYSREYLQKWILIANSNPNVNFYAYTKSLPYFKDIKLPENMDVIFSVGGYKDKSINYNKDRHAQIFDNIEQLEKDGYINASKIDYYATKFYSENKKVGLIYH